MSDSTDRLVAARLLVRVEGGAYASRLLAGPVARGVRARVLGVLRWQRLLDETLAPLCRRPFAALDPEVRAALRLGLHEATRLGVPREVATDAAVHLTRRLAKASAAGMVNAVLRRAVERHRTVLDGAAPDVGLSHPEWLYRRWASPSARPRRCGHGRRPGAGADLGVVLRRGGAPASRGPAPDCVRTHWCPGVDRAQGPERAAARRGPARCRLRPGPELTAGGSRGSPALSGRGRGSWTCAPRPAGKLALLGRLQPWRDGVRRGRPPAAGAPGGASARSLGRRGRRSGAAC